MNRSRIAGRGWRPLAWAGVAMLMTGGALARGDSLIGLATLLAGALALDALRRPGGWSAVFPAACLLALVSLPAWPPLAWLAAVLALAGVAAERAAGSMTPCGATENDPDWRTPRQIAP